MTLAAERDAGTPRKASARAPMTLPPTTVNGRSALAPSRRKRIATQVSASGRTPRGNRANHPTPAPATATPRSRHTTATPQPAASKALRMGLAPVENTRTATTATPAIQAVLITQLIAPDPPHETRPRPRRHDKSPFIPSCRWTSHVAPVRGAARRPSTLRRRRRPDGEAKLVAPKAYDEAAAPAQAAASPKGGPVKESRALRARAEPCAPSDSRGFRTPRSDRRPPC